LQAVHDLFIAINVVDENAVPILTTLNLDDARASENSRGLKPGVYNASCVLPANTFGERRFFLTIHLVYLKTEHLFVNKILEFEVMFKGYNSRYGSHGNVFIRPQLSWMVRPGCRERLSTRKV
jgi:hypothetical protein